MAGVQHGFGARTCQAASLNTDYSVGQPALGGLNLLASIPPNANRIGYVVQQQSTNALTVAFDEGGGVTISVVLLNAAGANGTGGDNIGMVGMPHAGRIRVYGATGSQCCVAEW